MPYNYKTELSRYRKYYQSLEPVLEKPQSRAYTAIIFSFLAVSLFGWYAIRPTVQTILFLRREIADKTVINKKMEDKISALIEAQAAYQEVEVALPAVGQALPAAPEALPLVIQVRNLASISGVLLNSVQVSTVPLLGKDATPSAVPVGGRVAPVSTDTQRAFDVAITIRGQYPGIRAFFEGIIAMLRIVTISEATITSVQAESVSTASAIPTNRLLQLALKVKGYYLVQ